MSPDYPRPMGAAVRCTPESCACGQYRPRDDDDEVCHCGCRWCDYSLVGTDGFHVGLREAMGPGCEHHARGQEVVIFTTAEQTGLIREIARDLEANGDTPSITWYRDDAGQIQGISLTAQFSSETVAAMKDAPFTKATVKAIQPRRVTEFSGDAGDTCPRHEGPRSYCGCGGTVRGGR